MIFSLLVCPCFAAEELPLYGDEWRVVALARTGELSSVMKRSYTDSVRNTLMSTGGKLSTKHTEYARVILALTAAGLDAQSFSGYDLTLPLADFDATCRQGLNGPVWALIALDSGEYVIPDCGDAGAQATRERYVEAILDRELSGGGFAFSGESADPDMTAMALTALSRYRFRADVRAAVTRAVHRLSELQCADGCFSSCGAENAESTAQVIIALNALGIDPADARFVKNGHGLEEALESFAVQDGFAHERNGSVNAVATFQGTLARAALQCALDGSTLYGMRETAYSDIASHEAREAVTALSRAGILSGFPDGTFRPESTMTRAQFAAVVTRLLQLEDGASAPFADVAHDAWYAGSVAAAYRAGLIAGRTHECFDPEGTVSAAEAGIILARAANMLGLSWDAPVWSASSPAATRGMIAVSVFRLARCAGMM